MGLTALSDLEQSADYTVAIGDGHEAGVRGAMRTSLVEYVPEYGPH